MKPSRFSEEQIIAILREQEGGAKTVDGCRKHGVNGATFCQWKVKYVKSRPTVPSQSRSI